MRNTLILMVTIAAGALATSASAQTARQIDQRVANMRRVLNLSGSQAGTIRRDLFAASDEKRQIKNNRALGPLQKDERLKEVRRSTREEVKAVLTPGQLRAWRAYRESAKPR